MFPIPIHHGQQATPSIITFVVTTINITATATTTTTTTTTTTDV
jgi:hypothetical protein